MVVLKHDKIGYPWASVYDEIVFYFMQGYCPCYTLRRAQGQQNHVLFVYFSATDLWGYILSRAGAVIFVFYQEQCLKERAG